MATIQIKNLGPIKDTGVIQMTPILLLMGEQGTGKSIFSKTLCFCRWIEKKCMLDGVEEMMDWYVGDGNNVFVKQLQKFHHISPVFFSEKTVIKYDGDYLRLTYVKEVLMMELKKKSYRQIYAEKVTYIPSERNILSVAQNNLRVLQSGDMDELNNLYIEWQEAQGIVSNGSKHQMVVSADLEYSYDEQLKTGKLLQKSSKQEFAPMYASSGIQSSLPMEVIVENLKELVGKAASGSFYDYNAYKKEYQQKQKKNIVLPELDRVTKYQSVSLFIEEPEQNLHPQAQWELVMHLAKLILAAKQHSMYDLDSYLMLTTHSPYVLMAINTMMAASEASSKDEMNTSKVVESKQIPMFGKDDISAYYIEKGRLTKVTMENPLMIDGSRLDPISSKYDQLLSVFDKIIYEADSHENEN